MNRCKAKTKSGKQCRVTALQGQDRCYFHSKFNRCQAKTKSGKRCTVGALQGQDRCYFHSKLNQGYPAVDPKRIETIDDLITILSRTVWELRRQKTTPQVANAIGYLAGILKGCLVDHTFEERLKWIEEELEINTNAKPKPNPSKQHQKTA